MFARLLFTICISLAVHYVVLGTVPGFDLILKPRKRSVEVEIITTKVKELPPAPVQKPGSSAVNRNAETNEGAEPAFTVPDIDIPDISGTDELDVKIPELNLSRLESTSSIKPDKELLKELKSTSDEFQKANRSGEGVEMTSTIARGFPPME